VTQSSLFISYNVNGLHSPIKRKKILGQLKSFNCHIAFLQEMHLSDIERDKKRGVTILVHRQINFTPLTTYRDPHGRYIVVNGSVDGVLVSLINIYAPNEDEPNFIHTISNLVLQKCSGVLLLGGDFNCVLSRYLDKQPSSKSHASQMRKALKHLTTELGLIDVWRNRFPRVRDYTFYSHRHASYSSIDFFFTSKTEEHRIDNIEILPITLSDHAPLSLSWDLGLTPRLKLWRLNASLLNDSQFCEFIHAELNTYLELNTTPEISPLTLWDCAKAYIRGRIISFASARKKRKEARRCELEAKIRYLEQQHKKAQTATLLSDLKMLRSELDSLLNEKIEGNLRFIKQKYYEQGSRASRLLAIRLRKQQTRSMVQKLKSDQTLITKPNQIASCFANFFESLYKNSDTCKDDNTLSDFLEKINLKTLTYGYLSG
uniref:exodeoxyribonuclease III n=1 Tax=Astatotilapia calliptera TaxID=8154 RepID=A0A3P8NIL1_ASTCA